MDARGFTALILNFVGAALVLVSMTKAFNLPAFVMETIWCAIALYGLAKLVIRRRK